MGNLTLMKFITNFTKSLLIISLISASMCTNLLRKSKTKDLELTLAADEQGSKPAIKALADQQVAAARKLLATPNAVAQEILLTAATLLKTIWSQDMIKDNEKNDANFNRSINGGIWKDKSVGTDDENTMMQMGRIAKVAKGIATPMDKAGVLAVLGDIGTAIFDCDKVKALTDVKTAGYCKIAHSMSRIFNMSDDELLADALVAKSKRGGSIIAPRKKAGSHGPAERANGLDANGSMNFNARSGLLSKNVDDSGFSAKWPWQLIPKAYLTKCKEPWAGHYSGSIVEVLFMLDLFTRLKFGKDHPLVSFTTSGGMLNNKERRCKGALAGAFLISIGYHSAIEVKPTIWMYLGFQKPSIFTADSTPAACDTHATPDMVKLMTDCTAA